MTDAREAILARIRAAVPDRMQVDVPRGYRGVGELVVDDLVGLLAERVSDYRATVQQCSTGAVAGTITTTLAGRGIDRVVVAPGFPDHWRPDDAVVDDPPLDIAALEELDGVVTTCACAIALTGTIVLDTTAGQGRRAISLVPDYHLVLVRADQIVAGLPDAVAVLDPTRPLTWISGPSATSDIELDRVEGVHGPRTLDVVIVT